MTSKMKKLYLGLVLVVMKLSAAALGSIAEAEACINVTLTFGFYLNTCPEAEPIIFSWVQKAVSDDPRMPASLLRLHFHDCIVNGCDASVLLDDTPSFTGEKTAAPNANSLRGFEVIDAIKADLEYVCPQTVSCADILAVAARDSVLVSGGPGWEVQMGRKDSLSASKRAADDNIPAPNSDLPTLLSKFHNAGLSLQDLIALSGAHTIGKARCSTFNNSDTLLQQLCSGDDANATLADLDYMTPTAFDNQYYLNLLSGQALLGSDRVLLTANAMEHLIQSYAHNPHHFFDDFTNAMIKMGSFGAVNQNGQIRTNCRAVNQILS